MKIFHPVFLLFSLFIIRMAVAAATVPVADDPIIAARDATRAGNRVELERLATELSGHELAVYVEYWRMQLDLGNGIDPATVRSFLKRNEGTYIAEKTRGDWLRQLGRKAQWTLFDAEYPALAQPDRELSCLAMQSRRLRGDKTMLDEAMPLWLDLLNPPDACNPVLEALILEKRIAADDVWARIRRQVETGRLTAARYSMNYLPQSQTPDSKTALAVTDKPLPWLTKSVFSPDNQMHRELMALAIASIARNDPRMAADQMKKFATYLKEKEAAWAWSQIGYQAARQHLPDALIWFKKAGDTPLSDDVQQWKVRAALRVQSWSQVRVNITKMPAPLSEQPTWIYWLGRAHLAEKRPQEAQILFTKLAGQTNFYGNLADEELGRKVTPPPKTTPSTAEEIARAEANVGLRRALALFRAGLRIEAIHEWNWAMRDMNDRELLAASALAKRSGVYDRAIAAADRTRQEHDYSLRYLAPFHEQVRPAAHQQSLDEAWVYGLMRQESRFVMDARSSAGASGLMQLMPKTARWVAKKIGLTDYRSGQVNDLETNLLLGTSYLRMVMEELDNHPVLALTAYNAGPGRARRWLGPRPLEGAIYAETIPFNETRDYVKKVMSNTLYYAALFDNKPQSIKERLGTVRARTSVPKTEDLP